jgi:sorbose reductase
LTTPFPSLLTTSSTPESRALSRFATPGTAILTGGAGNLALSSARALLDHGCSALSLLDLPSTLASSASQIDALAEEFPQVPIHRIACDVTSESAVSAAFAEAAQSMGSINMLCCFAGIVGCVHSIDTTATEFRRIIDVNLMGSVLCAQAAARYMIAQNQDQLVLHPTSASLPGCSIVFTASISGHSTNYPQPQAAYNASKTAIISLTKSLAAEWAVHGIRVNSISPGYLDTILNAGDSLKTIRDVWASRCPMGRTGDVEEVVGLVVLLCSQRSGRYITGSDFVVDGGAMCF